MSADEGKAAADEVDGSGKRQPAAGALRSLPAVGELLALPELRQLEAEVGRPRLLAAVRAAIAQVRGALRAGGLPADTALEGHPWEQEVRRSLAELGRPSPRPVINATGVVIHTNLGRVPLAERAIAAIAEAARGYTDLEYDLRAGERSSRQVHAAALLGELTGAEDALIVNNNAAGVLLATSALAAGGEVIVSRGELVEIGGSFRIPEVIVQGGARLVEVGTTNRTHLRDYQRAIGPATRLLLKVHRSNFVLRGFTAEVGRADLVRLGRDHGLPVVEDLGSGCLIDLTGFGLPGEPTVQQAVAAGCDLVCCSGDKLVGGPQAGLLLGRRETMARLRHHPLMRAVRPDKLTIAGLVATLTSYRDGRAREELPVLRMLSIEAATLHRRAELFAGRLQQALGAGRGERLVSLQRGGALAGGGSLPGEYLPGTLVLLGDPHAACPAHRLLARLRCGEHPVAARIVGGLVALDLRCVQPEEEAALQQGVLQALSAGE